MHLTWPAWAFCLEKIAWQENKDLQILMEVVIKNCSHCLMDLPVSWLQVTQVAPTSSPNQDVSHPGILSIFTLSTDSPYPVWVVSNWCSQKHKKNRSINLALHPPPSQDTSGKVKFCGNSRFPTKTWKPRVCARREGATPNSIYFTKQCGLGSSSHKQPPSQSVPASAKDLKPFFQPGPLIRRNPTQQCLPLGEERVVFLGIPFQSPRNWFLSQIGWEDPEFEKYL